MTTSSTVDVRRLLASDWSLLRTLRLNALTDSPHAFLGDLAQETAQGEKYWQDLVEIRFWFVAFRAGQPAGLAASVRDPITDHRYLESMWVPPGHRGQGVARALLQTVKGLAIREHKTALLLWVLDGNPVAAKVYRHYGFVESGRCQIVPDHPDLTEIEFYHDLSPRPLNSGDANSRFAAR